KSSSHRLPRSRFGYTYAECYAQGATGNPRKARSQAIWGWVVDKATNGRPSRGERGLPLPDVGWHPVVVPKGQTEPEITSTATEVPSGHFVARDRIGPPARTPSDRPRTRRRNSRASQSRPRPAPLPPQRVAPAARTRR